MSDSLRILLVDDDVEDQLITRGFLRQAYGKEFTLDCAGSWEEAVPAIRAEKHDVYLIDYRLGERSGIDLLGEVADSASMAPIIMLTGADNREIDLAAQAAGASDYLVKGELSAPLIDRAIRYAVERKSIERRLAKDAEFDPLTGLSNRVRFHSRLEAGIEHAGRGDATLAVLLLDLDHFKDVNDTLGHQAGDQLLQEVAHRLEGAVRATDTVARLGGDEFAIVATHVHDPHDVAVLAEKILSALFEPIRLGGHDIIVTTSIGITLCPQNGQSPDELLRNADLALYKAKRDGRKSYQFYSQELNAEARVHRSLENQIRTALRNHGFRLNYLPIIDLRSGDLAGVEALLRCRSSEGMWVLPPDLIATAESSGLIVPLGEWAMREACLQKMAWERSGITVGPVSVNLSAVQLRREETFTDLVRIIDETGINPSGLQVEVNEAVLSEKSRAICARLLELHDKGIAIAIDDFGRGVSSLSRLRRFPIGALKIDRSFVARIESDEDDAAIVDAAIQIGNSLGITVIAEGVETAAQYAFLADRGCRQAQGHWFCPASGPAELVSWIARQAA